MILEKLLEQPIGNPNILLRSAAYDASHSAALLREIVALANLPGDSARYIFFGVQCDEKGKLIFERPDAAVLNELENCQALVRRHIEPDIKVGTLCGSVRGYFLAAIEVIPDTAGPFLIRESLGTELQTGACWVRDGESTRPARRADLDLIYAAALPPQLPPQLPVEQIDSALPVGNVVMVGFENNPQSAEWVTPMPDLSKAPSVVAAMKMQNQISAVEAAGQLDVADSAVARLSHARLYGSELVR